MLLKYFQKKAHEIILVDISARNRNEIFDINLIKKIKNEIFVPLTIGGGINSLDDASKIIDQGVEKISLNTVLYKNPEIIEKIANKFEAKALLLA